MPESLLNLKPRLLTCVHCRYDILSDQPVPKCSRCGHTLVVVVHSAFLLRPCDKAGEYARVTGRSRSFTFHVEPS